MEDISGQCFGDQPLLGSEGRRLGEREMLNCEVWRPLPIPWELWGWDWTSELAPVEARRLTLCILHPPLTGCGCSQVVRGEKGLHDSHPAGAVPTESLRHEPAAASPSGGWGNEGLHSEGEI